MVAWRQIAALLVAPMLFGTIAAAESEQWAQGPPQFATVPVPKDPGQFDQAWGSEDRISLLEKLNRSDRDVLRHRDELVVPLEWGLAETDYSPLPAKIDWASDTETLILVHLPLQAFAAYEYGVMVHWGPVSSGSRTVPSVAGAYFLNWSSKGRRSTVNREWFLRWYFNFENDTGRSFHEYALPGLPVSHGCLRLLGRDASWLYHWGRSWKLDETGRNIRSHGTPVIMIGEYDFDQPPPWRDRELVEQGFELSRQGYWASHAAEVLGDERLREARRLLIEADN